MVNVSGESDFHVICAVYVDILFKNQRKKRPHNPENANKYQNNPAHLGSNAFIAGRTIEEFRE